MAGGVPSTGHGNPQDTMYRINWLSLALFVFQNLGVCDVVGLKAMVLKVPEATTAGSTVTLGCEYDLENTPLYSVKWYRGDEEFYRYVPKESPPTKVFPTSNINVDVFRSNSKEVTLHNVQRNLTGFYKCEVSADAPFFHTDIRLAHMIIAEIPSEGPTLTIVNNKVTAGSKLKANCTAPQSYPAVNLTWFANGELLHSRDGIHISSSVSRHDNTFNLGPPLESTSSRLFLTVVPEMFRSGRLKLRCLVTMYKLYRKTDEVEIVEDTPQLAPIRRPTVQPQEWHRNGSKKIFLPEHLHSCLMLFAAYLVGIR